jgi:phosphatidylserine/phosphatidylglycerophosphate/cardiolipin synthase-like enzyme
MPHMPTRSIVSRLLLILPLAVAVIAPVACDGGTVPDAPRAVEETVSGEWMRVYFTSPTYPDDGLHAGGLDETLVAVIARAESSVEVAAYDLDLETVTDALIAAHKRDVRVRLVTESDNADEDAVRRLHLAGIPVVKDGREWGLMHDKFVIVDGQWLWLGSWNLTENGTYRNNNHAVLIASAALAENYCTEFEEMFAGQFGPTSPADTPNPHVTITVETTADGGTPQTRQVEIETYFAPEDEVASRIIAEIRQARSRIRFMAFVFTSDEIAGAMLERAQEGVVVQGVMEARNAERDYSEYERLRAEVHDVLPDGNPYIMHHKVIIIDDETVILGSYNFTASADEDNDENVLVIHDAEVAALFVAEFGRVYEQARNQD